MADKHAPLPPPSADPYENAAAGHVDAVRSALGRDRGLATRVDSRSGLTLLHLAARYGHEAVARAVLEANPASAAVAARQGKDRHLGSPSSSSPRTPAEIAAFWGHDALAAELRNAEAQAILARGADGTDNNYPKLSSEESAAGELVIGAALDYKLLFALGCDWLDRAAHFRSDDRALAGMWMDARMRLLPMVGSKPLFASQHTGTRNRGPSPQSSKAAGYSSDLSDPDDGNGDFEEEGAPIRWMTREDLVLADERIRAFLLVQARSATTPASKTDTRTQESWARTWPATQAARAAGALIFLGKRRADQTPLFAVDLARVPDLFPPSSANAPAGTDGGGARDSEQAVLVGIPDARPVDMRAAIASLRAHPATAHVLATARALLSWHARNIHCSQCGAPAAAREAGWRRACSAAADAKSGCPGAVAASGALNTQYPRTDPVVMACVSSPDGTRLLLGRQRAWPPGMYSLLAGFIEPGEPAEAAVVREVFEEAGLHVDPGSIRYVASQPWPFPATLMFGFHARAEDTKIPAHRLDNELEDVRWVSADALDAILSGLRASTSSTGRSAPSPQIPVAFASELPAEGMFVPPRTSLAGTMIREWIRRWAVRDQARGGSTAGSGSKARM